jgi:hypothetical protein
MIDPKIAKLVKQFLAEVASVNKTWTTLQNEGVTVFLDTEGKTPYNSNGIKGINIRDITQRVTYMKETKEGK